MDCCCVHMRLIAWFLLWNLQRALSGLWSFCLKDQSLAVRAFVKFYEASSPSKEPACTGLDLPVRDCFSKCSFQGQAVESSISSKSELESFLASWKCGSEAYLWITLGFRCRSKVRMTGTVEFQNLCTSIAYEVKTVMRDNTLSLYQKLVFCFLKIVCVTGFALGREYPEQRIRAPTLPPPIPTFAAPEKQELATETSAEYTEEKEKPDADESTPEARTGFQELTAASAGVELRLNSLLTWYDRRRHVRLARATETFGYKPVAWSLQIMVISEFISSVNKCRWLPLSLLISIGSRKLTSLVLKNTSECTSSGVSVFLFDLAGFSSASDRRLVPLLIITFQKTCYPSYVSVR